MEFFLMKEFENLFDKNQRTGNDSDIFYLGRNLSMHFSYIQQVNKRIFNIARKSKIKLENSSPRSYFSQICQQNSTKYTCTITPEYKSVITFDSPLTPPPTFFLFLSLSLCFLSHLIYFPIFYDLLLFPPLFLSLSIYLFMLVYLTKSFILICYLYAYIQRSE